MTRDDLQRMSSGAEALRQADCDRAAYLVDNHCGGEQWDNVIETLLEITEEDSLADQLDVHTPADAATAAPSGVTAMVSARHDFAYLDTYSPEVSNTGLSMYHTPEVPPFQSTQVNTPPLLPSGGYDGGTSNSFFGTWNPIKRSKAFKALDKGKRGAMHLKRGFQQFITLGGENVLVYPRGKNVGNNKYEYLIEWGGYDLKIWGNPDSNPVLGDVRVRYSAEVILEYGIDEAQRRLIDWLSTIGFTPYPDGGEKLSNVDINVCVPIPVSEFESLQRNGHCVTRTKKNVIFQNDNDAETCCRGDRTRTQIKIYDKRVESNDKSDNFRKTLLFVQRHIGDEWFNSDRPITRVEFSIGRDRLKEWKTPNSDRGINSLAEFRAMERNIVDVLTFQWFRILAKPKVRGHENTAELHPHWVTVRSEFLRCFDGSTAPLTKVKKTVSFDHKRLLQQYKGIARKLIGFKYGKPRSMFELRAY